MLLVRRGWCRAATFSVPLFIGAVVSGCRNDHVADTVATVNGRAIPRADMERACGRQINGSIQTSQIRGEDGCRLSALNELIDEEILQQQAEKMHIAATKDDIESQLTEMKAAYTTEEFRDQLNRQGLTLDELRREIGRDQSQKRLFNKEINSKINVTDADIASYYRAHASQFNLPEPYLHLAKIVVNAGSDPGKALGKTKFLLDLLYSGEDFATVATQYSEDSETAAKGGDMDPIPESSMKSYPEIYAALSQRHPGQFTDAIPVRDPGFPTVSRYVVVKIIEIETAGQHQLTDPRVQQSIRLKIGRRRSQLMRSAYLDILRNRATVRNYFAEDFFKSDESSK